MKIVILITGLSGSGKSTLADGLQRQIGRDRVAIIDGDIIRKASNNLGFSRDDRFLHLQEMGKIACQSDELITIVAAIAPFEDARVAFKNTVMKYKKVIIIHSCAPLSVCEDRDSKGLYARARRGEIDMFTGISDPYEIPKNADLKVDSSTDSVDLSIQRVIFFLGAGSIDISFVESSFPEPK